MSRNLKSFAILCHIRSLNLGSCLACVATFQNLRIKILTHSFRIIKRILKVLFNINDTVLAVGQIHILSLERLTS